MSFISKSGCELQKVCITGKRSVTKASYRNAFPLVQKISFKGPYVGEMDDEEDSEV
jgi:hypothetical protein